MAVANAGFGVVGEVTRLTLDDYRRQFETNVFGVLRTVYATLDDLRRTRGRLVIIGSVSGHLSTPGASAYGMSFRLGVDPRPRQLERAVACEHDEDLLFG